MGVIVSTIHGMGADFITSTAPPSISVLNLTHADMKAQELVDELMTRIDNTDLAFVPMKKDVIDELCLRNVDFDAFYPSKERRIELLESMVRSRTNPNDIADTDRNFNDVIDYVESNDSTCCHKHKLEAQGQDVANNPMIIEYLESIGKEKQNNQ